MLLAEGASYVPKEMLHSDLENLVKNFDRWYRSAEISAHGLVMDVLGIQNEEADELIKNCAVPYDAFDGEDLNEKMRIGVIAKI